MVNMQVTMRQNYNGKNYLNGESLVVATEAEADDLVTLKMAVRVAPTIAPISRDMKAADNESSGGDAGAQPNAKQGQYKRRDMQPSR